MTTIAILGATGQIGKGLALELSKWPGYDLILCARNENRLDRFVSDADLNRNRISTRPMEAFEGADVIINAIGDGSRARQLKLGANLFFTTEHFDNLVTRYVMKHPKVQYIFLSSGAVYGFAAPWPVTQDATVDFKVNGTDPVNHYPLAKLTAEAKHRCLNQLLIYDVRIFGYFSRFINPDDDFFLSQTTRAVIQGKVLETQPSDMVRDYISQCDLAGFVLALMENRPNNGAYDICSRKTVTKFELLDRLGQDFGLKVQIKDGKPRGKSIGLKLVYPTERTNAEGAGYVPSKSSMENVLDELAIIAGSKPVSKLSF